MKETLALWRKKVSKLNLLFHPGLKKPQTNEKSKTCSIFLNRNFEAKDTRINLSLAHQNLPAMTEVFLECPIIKE